MGLYRVVLEATGGHGCQREYGGGSELYGCRRQDCPDCVVQEFVEKMKKIGQHVSKAELVHWPDAEKWGGKPVVDEFVGGQMAFTYNEDHSLQNMWFEPIHRIRHGWFPGHEPKTDNEPKAN